MIRKYFILFSFLPLPLFATNATWNGSVNNSWNVNNNWTPATFPNAAGDIANFVSGAPSPVNLTAPVTVGTLNFNSTTNYTIGGAPNTLTFQDAAGASIVNSNTSTNTLSAIPVQLNSNLLVTNNSASAFNITGVISGAGGITRTGAGGALGLFGANSYLGATNINTGQISYNVNASIPATSLVTIGDGVSATATLAMNAAMTSPNALNMTINSNGLLSQALNSTLFLTSLQGSGAVSLNTSNVTANLFDVNNSSDITFSGVISGGVGVATINPAANTRIVKRGTGTLTLSGSSTFLSPFYVQEGVVQALNNNALGAGGTNSGIFAQTGATSGSIYLDNNITIPKRVLLNGAGYLSTGALRNVAGNNTVTGNVQIGWAGVGVVASDATIHVEGVSSLTLSGILQGSNNLTKTGTGTLILSGGANNTITGNTIISGGTLNLNKTAGLNALAGNIQINSGTLLLSASNQIINTSIVTLNGGLFDMGANTETIGSLIFSSGTLNNSNTLALSNTSNQLTMGDNTTISGPLDITSTNAAVSYTGTTTRATLGNIAFSGLGSVPVFNINASADSVGMTVNGAISSSTVSTLTKSGAGTLRFAGSSANTYTGITGATAVSAGQLLLQKTAGVNAIPGNVSVSAGASLVLGDSNQISNAATVTINGGTFDLGSFNETVSVAAVNSGGIVNGSGTLSLSNNIASALSLGSGATVNANIALTGTGSVNYSGGAAAATINGNIDLGASSHTFSVQNGSATPDLIVNGVISGTGGVTMVGASSAARMDWAGNSSNTYSGTTTLNSGNLFLNKTPGINAIAGNIVYSTANGLLTLGNSDQIADTSNMTLSLGTFNMNGFNETMNSFSFLSGTFTQGGGLLSLASATTALTMRNTTITGDIALTGGGSVVFDSTNNGTATLNGNLNLGGNPTTFDIADGSAATDMLVGGVISNGAVTKIGLGLLEFSGSSPNIYTGLTTVSNGTLFLNKSTATTAIAGDILINGGTLSLGAAEQIVDSSNMTLNGGSFSMGAFNETLNSLTFDAGTLTQAGGILILNSPTIANSSPPALTMRDTTINGDVALTGGGSVVFDSTNNGTATLNGNLNLGGNPTTFDIADGSAATDMLVGGVISNGAVTKIGLGLLEFSGSSPNTYTGLTSVSSGTLLLSKSTSTVAIAGDILINGGSLTLGASEQIADSSNMTLSSGSFTMGAFNETLNSLTYNAGTLSQTTGVLSLNSATTALTMRDTTISGDVTLTGGGSVVFDSTNNGTATLNGNLNLGGNPTTFDIADGSAATDMLVGGEISNGALTKTGLGLLEFSGSSPNTYTGLTNVSSGILLLNKSASTVAIAGDILINGGGLTLGASEQIASGSNMTLSSGSFTMGAFNETLGSLTYNAGTLSQTTGILSLNSATTALTMRDTTINGNVTLTAGGSVVFDSTNNGTATLNGNLNLGGLNTTFNIANGTSTTDMLISGVISNGALTKTGAGLLLLSGANTYNGGTTVSGGTLQGDTTSLQGAIVDNATLIFDQAFDGTYAGNLSGTGSLIKRGSGKLIFSNANVLNGPTTIESGSFFVDGTFGGSGSLTTNLGTTLGGSGTISKNSTIGGFLNPGEGFGTIHFVGSETLASSSTLQIELTPTTNDFVNIVGDLTIQPNSNLSIIPLPGDYSSVTSYNIVHATTAISGIFSNVSISLPLFTPTIVYTANDIFIELSASTFSSLISKGNAGQVAHCLDHLPAPAGSDLASVISILQFIPTIGELKEALLQLQPSAFTSLTVALENNVLNVKDIIFNHLEQRDPCCCPSVASKCTLWLAPFAATTGQKTRNLEPGYQEATPGVFAGIDYCFPNNICFGSGIGYSHTDFEWKENRGDATWDSIYAALYGRKEGVLAFLEASILGSYNFCSIQRSIEFSSSAGSIDRIANSSHRGWLVDFNLRGGLFYYCNCLQISPYVDVDAISTWENGFKESGADSLNLILKSRNSTMVSTEIGVEFSRPCCALTPFLQLSVIRESRLCGKNEFALLGGECPMHLKGLYPCRTLGSLVAGFNARSCLFDFSLFYRGKYNSSFQNHLLEFTLSY